MQKLINDFINNTGPASIGNYFGGAGWPAYYNPGDPQQISGVNVSSQGSNYPAPATIAFTGGGGSGVCSETVLSIVD